jgi:hypothetical protein
MKISNTTLDILKNFSSINPSIVVKEGCTLRTISEQKSILAQATVPEKFPSFAIYDLNQFLGLVSLFKEPEFVFDDNFVSLEEGGSKSKYGFSSPTIITSPPDKNLELPTKDCVFDLPKETLKKVVNAANQLGLPDIVVRTEDGKINLCATDVKNPTTNEFTICVGDGEGDYSFVFRVENFKFIADDYKVEISSGISRFFGNMVVYWVALENTSKRGSK